MKKYLFLLLFVSSIFAQNRACEIDYEEKTDSTYIKKTKDFLVHEKVFGDSKELISLTLLNNNGVPSLGIQIIQKNSIFIPSLCFDSKSKILFLNKFIRRYL